MSVIGGNSIDHNEAYEGMLADGQLSNTVSKLNTLATNIPFGRGIVSDGDDGGRTPNNSHTSTNFVGILKYELNRAYQDGDVHGAIPDYDATIITVGSVFVTPTVDVDRDDPVYMIIGNTAGAGVANAGRFTNVAGTGATTAVLIAGAQWTRTATAGVRTKLSLGIRG